MILFSLIQPLNNKYLGMKIRTKRCTVLVTLYHTLASVVAFYSTPNLPISLPFPQGHKAFIIARRALSSPIRRPASNPFLFPFPFPLPIPLRCP